MSDNGDEIEIIYKDKLPAGATLYMLFNRDIKQYSVQFEFPDGWRPPAQRFDNLKEAGRFYKDQIKDGFINTSYISGVDTAEVYREIVTAAKNEGDCYPTNFYGAVNKSIKQMKQRFSNMLDELHSIAVDEVFQEWQGD